MVFQDNLKAIRNSRGISQTELAKMLNVGRSTIAMYETGDREPNFETLQKLSQIFGCSVDYLLTGKPGLTVSASDPWFPDEDEDELLEELQILRDSPETRTLLHSSRGLTREQLAAVTAMIRQLRGTE